MTLKKIKKTLTTNKSSTQLTRLCFFLGLFLIVSIISSKAVFACGITSATLWIGDTTEQAENHNTSIVYRPKAISNGWHIQWDLSPPDDSVEGFIWDTTDDLNRGAFWGGPSDRDASGGSSYLPGLSVGPHIIKAKIRKVGSESWYWSNARTLVYVAVDKIKAYFNGSWHDADENDTFVLVKGTKYTFKAFPYPSTASWPTAPGPNPTPSWQLNGNNLNPSGEDTKEITFDTFGSHTLVARCGPYDYNSVTVIIPFVHKVVKEGTTHEGPLYVCLNDTVGLEAKPYPSDVSFPAGEPHWTIESQPAGANAALDPNSGSATTTLSGLTELGEYVIKAQCGDSDTGDTITVCTPSTSGPWEDWIPFSDCPPENWSFIDDECDNWLSVYCDSTNHLNSQAFSWWYKEGEIPDPDGDRGTEVGCCVWVNGSNLAQYKYSFPGKKIYLKTEQISCNDKKGFWDNDWEGCLWYYCYRFVTFDCVTEEKDINWYRDSSTCYCEMGAWPNPSSADNCPGTVQKHPGYPD